MKDADWNSAQQWRLNCQTHWGAPSELDLVRFVEGEGTLCGAFPLSLMARAVDGLEAQPVVKDAQSVRDDERGVVWFEILGESRVGGRERLVLRLQSKVCAICQRCMDQMDVFVSERVVFDVVSQAQFDRAQKEDEDPDSPEMLVGTRQFDLMALLEDQLVLAIPYVPRHKVCSGEMVAAIQSAQTTEPEAPKSPFEVLANLKKKR